MSRLDRRSWAGYTWDDIVTNDNDSIREMLYCKTKYTVIVNFTSDVGKRWVNLLKCSKSNSKCFTITLTNYKSMIFELVL